MPRDDKVAILKESLAAIGRRIEIVLETKQAAGEDRDRWRRHLWTCVNQQTPYLLQVLTLCCRRFVTLFWPKKVKAGKLEEIHAKMVIKEAGDANIPKKPRLSSNGKPAGNGATPSTSVRTNGKLHRGP
jgi:chromodomain-helicase-DNA-binding protein 1